MPPKSMKEVSERIKELEEYLSPLDQNCFPFFPPYTWLMEYLWMLKLDYMRRKNWIWMKEYRMKCYDMNAARKSKL